MSTIGEIRSQLTDTILWKADLLFRGVRYTPALTDAVTEGAAPNYWPYRLAGTDGIGRFVPIPYLFKLNGAVARVRTTAEGPYSVERQGPGFALWFEGKELCPIEFVKSHAWQSFKTSDGGNFFDAGVEQLGDMLVVNLTPGCEYFLSRKPCAFCGYGRFGPRTNALGQIPGTVAPSPAAVKRMGEVLVRAAETGEARHVYIVGGSTLSPADEEARFLPVIETARKAVGDRLRVTVGSGAVDRSGSLRFRDAGADSCCYNLETWDPRTFEAVCPGKTAYVGRDRWIRGLVDAVEVFGWGNVASAFVIGVELLPPGPCLTPEAMLESAREGAAFLLDHGIMPVYSPLWPVEGTEYAMSQGIPSALYLQQQHEFYQLRAGRNFPVPKWLICPDCSYMLMEVDFDAAYGLAGR